VRILVSQTHHFPVVLLATALLGLPGCGHGEQSRFIGKLVRRDGTPLVGARVVVRSNETQKPAYGTTDASGQVSFNLPNEEHANGACDYEVMIVEDNSGGENSKRTIAAKYQDPKKSGLKVTAQPGEHVKLDVTLDPP
jgi:hypothetical protein